MATPLCENRLPRDFLYSQFYLAKYKRCIIIRSAHTRAHAHTWTHARAHTAMQIQPTGLNINTETKQIEAPCLVWVLCMSGNERLFAETKTTGSY